MSTYWYFLCTDHNPPLQSEDEVTQHTDDEHYARAVRQAFERPLPNDLEGLDYFERNARRFLIAHPSCNLELVSEYHVRRALAKPIRCPICGEYMKSTPYKTIAGDDPHAGEELSSGTAEPEWLRVRPPSGHHYTCPCGVDLRVPVTVTKAS